MQIKIVNTKIKVKNIIKQLVLFFVFFVFEMLSFSFFFSYLCIRFEDFAINSARNSSSDLSLIKEVCSALWQT